MYKFKSNKKAFTLVELLIVIAVIGILFIVLVSSVDNVIDKAKTAGVQTDFRSYQYAIEQVARKYNGFNTFGWDTGDLNGDRVLNRYDVDTINVYGLRNNTDDEFNSELQNETWTGIYTMINPADEYDNSAILALQNAINEYLDPSLKIRIGIDGKITMMNNTKDPWGNEYEGIFITNATADAAAKYNTDASMIGSIGDNKDRGSIIIWSKGPNGNLGSKIKVENGMVTATASMIDANTPDNNIDGSDDLIMSITYTFSHGFGKPGTQTFGFSKNQTLLDKHNENTNNNTTNNTDIINPSVPDINDDIIVPDNENISKPENDVVVEPDNSNEPEDIPNEEVEIVPVQYVMLSGEHKIVNFVDRTLMSSADVSKFSHIKVNDEILSEDNYIIDTFTTTVEFSRIYVNTLPSGTYKVEIWSTDGWAECTIEIPDEPNTLDKWTWDDLKWLASRNLDKEVLMEQYNINLGDTKEYNGVVYTLVDYGEEYGGFIFMYFPSETSAMNATASNIGGYGNTPIAQSLNKTYEELPEEIKSAIKTVNVEYATNPYNANSIKTIECKLFIPSIKELGFRVATNTPGWDGEGETFGYFDTDEDVISEMMGYENDYWLRSIDYTSSTKFQYILGGMSYMTCPAESTTEKNIVVCFVIGE